MDFVLTRFIENMEHNYHFKVALTLENKERNLYITINDSGLIDKLLDLEYVDKAVVPTFDHNKEVIGTHVKETTSKIARQTKDNEVCIRITEKDYGDKINKVDSLMRSYLANHYPKFN